MEEIALNLYKEENYHLYEKAIFYKLPIVIRDVILIINFDTELNMQGILGFLENSTGLFLDDTIETLERIQAEEDYKILKAIRSILQKNNVSTSDLRVNVDSQEEYSVNNFIETHGSEYDEMADEICKIADRLYLYSEDRNIFDNLVRYVDTNKSYLIEELTK
ncbi:hypothetical protein TS65_25430 [Aneurinibacillus migulanus]|uniref:DNA mimic protein DMP19 C-terminal domain-containing protein n=1 Tax=Aneurinibacillus migulanus TaxID=47500 RepID=A0A0D1XYR7_ANEMI|nr:hypothetical protein TS65_25430 [Aneurinibacillus migulanus]KON98694.1 hypothetical protein AF333_23905 [Aneurinibacillus migulanus]